MDSCCRLRFSHRSFGLVGLNWDRDLAFGFTPRALLALAALMVLFWLAGGGQSG